MIKVSTFATLAVLITGLCRQVSAEFVVTGYSNFNDYNATDGSVTPAGPGDTGKTLAVVNYAVYHNDGTSGGNWETQLGVTAASTSSPSFVPSPVVATAQYVYMYQVVNYSSTADALSVLNVAVNPKFVTSVGYLTDTIFVDGQGAVGPTSNVAIGGVTTNSTLSSEPAGNQTPTFSSSSAVTFTSSSGAAISPTTGQVVNSSISPNPPAATAVVRFQFSVNPNEYTTIMFFTSNQAPTGFYTSKVTDGTQTFNDLPSAVPLPASLALLLSGVPGLMGVGVFLRRSAGQMRI